jgi:hypothetical protein
MRYEVAIMRFLNYNNVVQLKEIFDKLNIIMEIQK